MFGRELKTKLPELRRAETLLDEDIRDRDWSHKLVHKAYADDTRKAAPNPVFPGELLLLNNTSGKLEVNFESEPDTVQSKDGTEVKVKCKDGGEYRRNSFFVKSYNLPEEENNSMQDVDPETVRPEPV